MSFAIDECFAIIARRWADELVITSAGNSSEVWWETTHDLDKTFYLEASMSLSTMFAAGVAMNYPTTKVWAFMGDGAFVMNTGMLFVERDLALKNMVSIIVSNKCYGATESVSLPSSGSIDFAAIVKAAGIARVFVFSDAAQLEAQFDEAFRGDEPTTIVLDLDPPTKRSHSPPYDGPELKYRFGRALEKRFDRKILP